MDDDIRENLTTGDTWLRLLWLILIGILAGIAVWLIWLVALVQFFFTLFTGRSQPHMDDFAAGLVAYTQQAFNYMTYQSDERPFPFAPLPSASDRDAD